MADDTAEYVIRFEGVSLAEAGRLAARLRSDMLDVTPDVEATVEKADPSTQDPGSILVLVLGTPAIIAVARGLASFIRRERAASIVIESDGKVIAEGLRSEDAAKIAEVMARRK